MPTKSSNHCDIDNCQLNATFASEDLKHFACTRHARKGFTVYPTLLESRAFGTQATYYREGMGNLRPLSGMAR